MDLIEYVAKLGQEKFRAIILWDRPERSRALSEFGRRLQGKTGGSFLDLLAVFQEDADLASNLDCFGPEQFRTLLIESSKGKDVVVVDRSDFLLDSWTREERRAFYRMVKQQWNSFLEESRATLVFLLQRSSELEDLRIEDSRGWSRILALAELGEIS